MPPMSPSDPQAPAQPPRRAVALLLNAAHAIDHMFLLIFATAVVAIAQEFGISRWEDLMPYSVGAFFLFGIGSIPAGRLGDLWGRRAMMLVFYFGMGASALVVAATQSAWQIAIALTLLGAFSAIYHPVGIPMLLQGSRRPGFTIGLNGLVGNLGIALSALATGFLVKYFGWRTAFAIPGLVAIGAGVAFAWLAPREHAAPARRRPTQAAAPRGEMMRALFVMLATAITGSFLFNITTNGNQQLLTERFAGVLSDPALLGALLALVYAIASLAQLVVGRMIDRHPIKRVFLCVVLLQAPLFVLAAGAEGWTLFVLQTAFMVSVFGAIPFSDAMTVRYVDDSQRSRISGWRIGISFGISSLAVWLLGPVVKAAGFQNLLLMLAAIALATLGFVLMLPSERRRELAGVATEVT
jgi:MFS family permease